MKHWLEHADPPIKDGTIIALIDPDMIFIRPLHIDFKNDNNVIYAPSRDRRPKATKVQKGAPGMTIPRYLYFVSMTLTRHIYSYLICMLQWHRCMALVHPGHTLIARTSTSIRSAARNRHACLWSRPSVTTITGKCMYVRERLIHVLTNPAYAYVSCSAGPPYMLERSDMLRVVSTWTLFVPRYAYSNTIMI